MGGGDKRKIRTIHRAKGCYATGYVKKKGFSKERGSSSGEFPEHDQKHYDGISKKEFTQTTKGHDFASSLGRVGRQIHQRKAGGERGRMKRTGEAEPEASQVGMVLQGK